MKSNSERCSSFIGAVPAPLIVTHGTVSNETCFDRF